MSVINPYAVKSGFAKDNKVPVSKGMLMDEVSVSRSKIYRGLTFSTYYNPDELVGKKGLQIYRDMKADDQVRATLTIKKYARLSTPWDIKAGDETNPTSVEMADMVRYVLKNLKGTFERTLLDILTALEYGYSISEKVFKVYEQGKWKGKIGLAKLGTREPFGYDFVTDGHCNVLGLTCEGTAPGGMGTADNPYPPDKFVIYSYNSEHDNPYGTSDLRSAYRPWWSKDINIKWWNIFNERFGAPTVMANYPAKGRIDKKVTAAIDDILNNLQARSGFRVPDNVKFELLEATRKGEATYKQAIDTYDNMISRSVLVPSLLGFQEAEGGSFALGKKHFDVFLFVLEMLGRDIEETIVGDQIIRPLIMLNYGEIDEDLMPRFEFESLVDEDTEARTRVAKMLADGGLIDKREDWVREYLMLPERDLDKYPHATPIGEAPAPPVNPFQPEDPNKPPRNPQKKQPPGKPDPERINDDKGKKKFTMTRAVVKFEQKVDFGSIESELTLIGGALKTELQTVVGWWKEDVLKKSARLLQEQDLKGVEKIKLRFTSDFKNYLRDYTVKIHLDSKLNGLEEVQEGGFNVNIQRRFGLLMFQNNVIEPWEPLPPREAMEFFNKKVIAKVVDDETGKKKLLSLGKMKELSYYDRKAFAVTGIENDYILAQTKMLLLNGIKNGTTNETMVEIEKVFDKYLDSGELKDGKLVSPSRLETIVRTNTAEAFNEGRKKMFNDPEVADFVPYVMWSSILDGRTSAYCESMDGKIFRKGEVLYPPAHFSCRSIAVPITTMEVEEVGGVKVDSWAVENGKQQRARGFAADPIPEGSPIVRCIVASCASEDIVQISNDIGTRSYICLECGARFRITPDGIVYLYNPGDGTWRRQTRIQAGEVIS